MQASAGFEIALKFNPKRVWRCKRNQEAFTVGERWEVQNIRANLDMSKHLESLKSELVRVIFHSKISILGYAFSMQGCLIYFSNWVGYICWQWFFLHNVQLFSALSCALADAHIRIMNSIWTFVVQIKLLCLFAVWKMWS